MSDIVVLDGARTAFTEFCGSFRELTATDLGVEAAKEAIRRSGLVPGDIDDVYFGNALQTSGDALFLARHVGLRAGVPQEVPALTVNRLCGSGLQALLNGAQSLRLGEATMVLAGGTENMSQAPFVVRGSRWGLPLGHGRFEDSLWESLLDTFGSTTMGMTAENVASRYELSRDEVDAFAEGSHQRALAAMEKGYLQEEIVPVQVPGRKGPVLIDRDEHPRLTPKETLARLKARFKKDGVVTPGNASGINDGAAALVLTTSKEAEKRGLKPLGRLVASAVVGVEPEIMGMGPVPAIRQALKKAGMTLNQLDLIEINEAFAAQYLGCQKELDFDPAIGNVNGGAVALGHPLGASGARITLSLLYELRRRGKRFGVTSLCIGGGQGIAAIWENLQ
ncbi:acetyl-CoA C-acetyltransferase [Heliophilum fasciatum]|uniref:Acetyl-CoA acetyltransferase n=1 Tax=Heliophilum fasciatum TaxID=35700 RepID=A0A4R2RNV7_9FIRM|nr:acetyl-CoA C-acetyltransferase [Heliophilum fasciatum]MCW2278182.1 acetyl-CoA C-acetyltransferase [Heliophilum fasciatum]TCP63997.1 acetyl-CoA C-acetyltransferase [Heliophilum fasciatum]